MTTDQRHVLGRAGEEYTASHFERLGFEVLARRHRTRFGELDLIVRDAGLLVFVEVKARRAGGGHPFDNLDAVKRAQVRRMAAAWLHDTADRPYFEALRFDAVGVVVDREGALVSLEHLEGAF
ncbi:MAG: putative endonuclease [Solirubrobacteraceae bacterium]|jgi:putative endonuclease|nr:putative endonuclease [Solirubrobacteraceae bacterium]